MAEMSEAKFDQIMREIDEEIRRDGYPIPGRESHAIARFCERFQTSIGMDNPMLHPIQRWYERTYGDRLAVDWSYGSSIALVQDDIYEMRCVRLYGTEVVAASPLLFERAIQVRSPVGTPHPVTNLLGGRIVDLTPELGKRTSESDCAGVLDAYGRMFMALHGIDAALGERFDETDAPYTKEAKHDIKIAVESLMSTPPNYGLSKWESLQATEKVLKSCILQKGATHKRSHSLEEVCGWAAAAGVPTVDQAKIAVIECNPDVRYNSVLVTKSEAIEAHYASLDVIAQLAPLLKRTTSQAILSPLILRLPTGRELKALILEYSPHDPTV